MERSRIACPHGVPIELCGHPVCKHVWESWKQTAGVASQQPAEENELPRWLDGATFSADDQLITLHVRTPDDYVLMLRTNVPYAVHQRTERIEYLLTSDQARALVELLTRLIDRSEQVEKVIDVPS